VLQNDSAAFLISLRSAMQRASSAMDSAGTRARLLKKAAVSNMNVLRAPKFLPTLVEIEAECAKIRAENGALKRNEHYRPPFERPSNIRVVRSPRQEP
jgi:hypothetical protein